MSIIKKVRNVKLLIAGFTKTTLLDFPGLVAATIFTGGCNYRCPFCHNGDIALGINCDSYVEEREILDHLLKRKNVLQGVCISGGEPTLQNDIEEFIKKIKALGYKVKLDTNGSNPECIANLLDKGLLDYIAMDIKNSCEKYEITVGKKVDLSKIKQSISMLINSRIDYEFRTTVVKEFHEEEDFVKIDKMISGAKKYYIQSYKDSDSVIKQGLTAYSKNEILKLVSKMQNVNPILRGID